MCIYYWKVWKCSLNQHYTNTDWCRGQHWKIMPWSCAMLSKGQRTDGNIAQLQGVIFQCWSRQTVNICFVISQNKCNEFVSSSMTRQHTICIDLPDTVDRPKNRCKCMVSRSLHHVPREHDAALTNPGNIVYFCTSRDVHWTNHNCVIQMVI